MKLTDLSRAPVLVAALGLAACASSDPQSEANCELSGQELEAIKVAALDYLMAEWPVMDRECQEISDVVVASDPGKCAIAGAPRIAEGCARPSYQGYGIVFDSTTREFEGIHFKTE